MTSSPIHAPLVGIGFGPAGIALAVALSDDHEFAGAEPHSLGLHDAVFLERAEDSAWQPGMILPGTDIQHHFLRDFSTPRFPSSRFGFVQYLHAKGRLYPFTLKSGYVSRSEWSDYCLWVAEQVRADVRYRTEVTALEPVVEGADLVAVDVVARALDDGTERRLRTTRLVLSTGHQPVIPEQFRGALGPRVFHSSQFSAMWSRLDRPRRVAVLGGGQNAGEILLHLHATTDVDLVSIVRNSGIRTFDLGHFSNQAYWPQETDYFYALPGPARRTVFEEQHGTNYAAVDGDVSHGLYQAWYEGEVTGRQRLTMLKRTVVRSVVDLGDQVRLELQDRHTGESCALTVDAVIIGTGYAEEPFPAVLEPMREHVAVDEDGLPEISRDFELRLSGNSPVQLYLNGMSERRHGIANATSFSVMALRAGQISAAARAKDASPELTTLR